MKVVITGVAGFIDYHLGLRLLNCGIDVIGIDNLNDYYSVSLKNARLEQLYSASSTEGHFYFYEFDIADHEKVFALFDTYKPEVVVNLAAQAGVRYSLENPYAYIKSNIDGFLEIIEAAKTFQVQNFIYASSSSVYGGNASLPFNEDQPVNHPLSLYAATKRSNELIAHTYSHLFALPTTGLRFFTVYGPWGRPDMALFLFTKAILEDRPINVYNNGNMARDFTYIDDVVECLYRLVFKPASPVPNFNTKSPTPSCSWSPYRIFNVGKSSTNTLLQYIEEIEKCVGKKSEMIMMPLQPGDVTQTLSDSHCLYDWINFKPAMTIQEGVSRFVQWYNSYYY